MFFPMCSRKINLVITSTLYSQYVEGDRMFGLAFTVLGFVPTLKNCIPLFSEFNLFVQMDEQTISTITFKI